MKPWRVRTSDGPGESWWPEGVNREVSYLGPSRLAQRPASLTRTAMVAATVAAVASSAVLVPSLAGAASKTGEYPVVSSATSATLSGQASASVSTPQIYTGEGGAPGINYTVKPGDTLHDIAARYGLTTMQLINANNLPNPDLIYPGDHVNIPAAGGAESVTVEVKAGDTINKLATAYGVDPSAIIKLASNKITNPNLIIVGQKLTIPGPTKTPAANTASLASTTAPAPASTSQSQDKDKDQSSTQAAPAQPQSTPAPQQPTPTPTPKPAPTQAPAPAATQGFIWPVQGTITQKFGPTSLGLEPAYMGYAHFHQGLDIANAMYTPIHAAAAGTVIFAGWSNYGYGFCVQIDHGNGLVTLYGHMAQQPSVSVGQHVNQGQLIGKMGSTGASTGSHTHFAVQKNGVWVNPLDYLP